MLLTRMRHNNCELVDTCVGKRTASCRIGHCMAGQNFRLRLLALYKEDSLTLLLVYQGHDNWDPGQTHRHVALKVLDE